MSDAVPVKRILVLAANPKGTSRLRLDAEVRDIEAGLRRSKNRDQFVLTQQWAVRPRDIQRAMLDVDPQIVHFSGHGSGDEGLVFEDEVGLPKLIEGQALARLFDLFSDKVECVVLNGCYSEVQAQSIAQYIKSVIGMTQAIGDEAAIEFSVGFYDALGAGRSVDFAYELGCSAIAMAGMQENLTPVLIQKADGKKSPSVSTPQLSSQRGRQKIELFLSYSHKDERLRDELAKHLKLLERQQVISAWHDRDISAGTEWASQISEHLETAKVILPLISADFLASDYCYDIELARAMERHELGEARIIPVILRPVDWTNAPFGKLQALPNNAKPITTWENQDLAFENVVKGIRLVCEELLREEQVIEAIRGGGVASEITAQDSGLTKESFQIFDVFKTSGVPTVTFVEPQNFHLIKLALMQPGVGVVIEGPSGIGKTTALRKALEEVNPDDKGLQVRTLSARKPQDLSHISTIQQWHNGIAIIDDFHRLEATLQEKLVDYLKYLADNELPKKLIIVGIPSTGKRLVNMSFDVATRVKFFKLGKVADEIILKMIRRGEAALNIVFDRRTDIARSSNGSLNIAQFLCYHLTAHEGISETQKSTEIIAGNLEIVISEIMSNELSLKFEDAVRCFASLDDYTERTCIELLKELSRSSEGFVSLKHARDARPEINQGIDKFIAEDYMKVLYDRCPESRKYLLYDKELCALIGDHPQLVFYLFNTPSDRLSTLAGKTPTS
ncbi:TIR domain-containing protein [Phormidesmis sp. 146-12]